MHSYSIGATFALKRRKKHLCTVKINVLGLSIYECCRVSFHPCMRDCFCPGMRSVSTICCESVDRISPNFGFCICVGVYGNRWKFRISVFQKLNRTEPASKFKNRRFPRFGFQKPTLAVWGQFFTLSHSQYIVQHDRINSQSIFLHAVSLHLQFWVTSADN